MQSLARAGYAHADGLAHLFLAMAAYCQPARVARWDCAPCAKASAAFGARGGFAVRRQFYGNASSMQGYVASGAGLVVVSFRGSVEYLSYWIDLEEYRTAPYPDCDACLVHSGFLSAWEDVRADVLSGVRDALRAQPDAALVVVGHSLGGAVAVIAALQLAKADGAKPPAAVFTFGEPRIGNAAFALFYEAAAAHWATWRVTHEHDLVPHLPPRSMLVPFVLDYAHHTREVWYHAANASAPDAPAQHRLCSAKVGEDFDCADSVWVYELSIADHLHYLGQTVGVIGCADPARSPRAGRAPADDAAALDRLEAGTPAAWRWVRALWRTVRARLADELGARMRRPWAAI
ncbi:hypothetical protein KFE25_009551 [Diacronema lutheri]|uniref:Fungal lipase-type domain-containing protein n=1 Tax=Diacronema lutheri TaxID=2081491 RepID=A0A8J5Y3U6_DIALT|nr:hypothetical protein KFE25_009551 [Diacronema lutheri]